MERTKVFEWRSMLRRDSGEEAPVASGYDECRRELDRLCCSTHSGSQTTGSGSASTVPGQNTARCSVLVAKVPPSHGKHTQQECGYDYIDN